MNEQASGVCVTLKATAAEARTDQIFPSADVFYVDGAMLYVRDTDRDEVIAIFAPDVWVSAVFVDSDR